MLDDRSYMRENPLRPTWSVTTILMVANGLIFALQQIFPSLIQYFALSKEGLMSGFLWQVLTFQFLHGGFWHLFLNMLCLFFFGRVAEYRLGGANFLKLYLYSGVAGGLLQTMLGFVSAAKFGGPVVGASAGVYGLIAAFSLLEPHAIIRVWFILPIKALYFMYIAGGISLFYMLAPGSDGIAHAAHLGGLLAGVIFMRWDSIRGGTRASQQSVRPVRFRPRELMRVRGSKKSSWGRPPAQPENPPVLTTTEFISREVDPILEKISAHGLQSLTPREREILEAARSKMRRR